MCIKPFPCVGRYIEGDPVVYRRDFVFGKIDRRNLMDERKKLELISSVEIMNTPMKKQRFIVDGMIYPGIHILSGDPKIYFKTVM